MFKDEALLEDLEVGNIFVNNSQSWKFLSHKVSWEPKGTPPMPPPPRNKALLMDY